MHLASMHRAQVNEWGQAPVYTSVPAEDLTSDGIRIKVEAVGVHNVVRARAAGKHYTASILPHVPGTDGVGVTDSGQRVYFMTHSASTGSFSEHVVVPAAAAIPVPAGLDTVQIAALVNPALSSWMSMTTRARLPHEFTVLILGATSSSGKIAISLARALGAKKVIGAARGDQSKLDLDEQITLSDDTNFDKVEVDLILDYVYGPVTEQLLRTIKTPRPVQYVQIGVLGGEDVALPAALLRSKDITLRGSGPGSWSMPQVEQAMPTLLEAMRGIPTQPVKVASMKDIEREWSQATKERLVFVP